MEEIAPEYDVVVLGTGLTECILSGVMSVKGKKVLHMDRNDHYGGEAASVNLEALFKKYGNYQQGTEPWKKYGRANDWNIDLVPKLLMSNGELTNILVSTDVTRYIEFKQIAGSYVQQGSGSRATVAKVPSDAGEALRSPLMGLFEKRRARNFLQWVGGFHENNPSTHNGMNLSQTTMKQVYDKYGLEATTRDFIGHSMALYTTDEYVDKRGGAKDCVERIRLYVNSMARYGKSPYIYPLYGLGELPQGFARLSAIYGGTYMLNTNVEEIKYEGGKVSGIRATMKERGEEGEGMKFETKCKKIIAELKKILDASRELDDSIALKERSRGGLGGLARWAAGGAVTSKSPEEEREEAARKTIAAVRESIILFLQGRLQEASSVQSDMMEVRLGREVEKSKSMLYKSRMGGGNIPYAHDDDPNSLPSPTKSKRNRRSANLSNGSLDPSNHPEDSSSTELSQEQIQLFAEENNALLQHYNTQLDQVRSAEKSILEISELHNTLHANLQQQSEHIDQLVQDSYLTTENLGKGNKELKRASERRSTAQAVFWGTVGFCSFLVVWDLIF